MKTKNQQLQALKLVQKQMTAYLNGDRVYREVHIPVWQFRMWGGNIKSAANFLERELRKDKVNAKKKRCGI